MFLYTFPLSPPETKMLEMIVGDEYAPAGKAMLCIEVEDGNLIFHPYANCEDSKNIGSIIQTIDTNILTSLNTYYLFQTMPSPEHLIKTAFADTKATEGWDILMYYPSTEQHVVRSNMEETTFMIAVNAYKVMMSRARQCSEAYGQLDTQMLISNYSNSLFKLYQLKNSPPNQANNSSNNIPYQIDDALYTLRYISRKLGEPYIQNAEAELEKMGILSK